MNQLQLGLLNFASINQVQDCLSDVQELIDYATLADQLGFSRFWLAEHQSFKRAHTWTSPDMLLPLLAAATSRIRIGIAGTLIGGHCPLDIATNYKMLANLFPGRIDLGLANGGTSNSCAHVSTPPDSGPDPYTRHTRELVHYLRSQEFFDGSGLVIPPLSGELPDLWLLGSSYRNTGFALELGANFSRSAFHLNHDPAPDTERLHEFIGSFQAKYDVRPQITLALAICCHENPRRANEIAAECLNQGNVVLDNNSLMIGTAQEIADRIHAAHERYAISEFILLQLYRQQDDRLRGIERIASAFKLVNEKAADRIN
jgi:luciferase family oxidoreductase group 1